MHVSNVVGTVNPVADVVRRAHAAGSVVLIDGTQAVPQMPVDLRAIDADFYAWTGHKAYGPTGIGVLHGRRALLEEMPPFIGGGHMIRTVAANESTWADLPWKFEAGTSQIAEAIGLGVAVDWMQELGMTEVRAHEEALVAETLLRLGSEVPGSTCTGRRMRRTVARWCRSRSRRIRTMSARSSGGSESLSAPGTLRAASDAPARRERDHASIVRGPRRARGRRAPGRRARRVASRASALGVEPAAHDAASDSSEGPTRSDAVRVRLVGVSMSGVSVTRSRRTVDAHHGSLHGRLASVGTLVVSSTRPVRSPQGWGRGARVLAHAALSIAPGRAERVTVRNTMVSLRLR